MKKFEKVWWDNWSITSWWSYQENTSQEAIEALENSRENFCVGAFLRHWETLENTATTVIPKSNYAELTEKGVQEIQHQAELRKKMGIPTENLTLHFSPAIKRNIQTAHIFCTSLGLEFPDDMFFEEVDVCLKKELILRELLMYLMWWNDILNYLNILILK